ncbi:hypothetical protein [Paraburkholderia sp. ZP32-5]|uniref:hypothetical protein n=1 Tax=Paraburkholderia sp. ZP32-5 TaxID=2883245 RepID=UPI001F262E59|nr:hypothetical protein [Paraburkholderia sp. ZP32-5]
MNDNDQQAVEDAVEQIGISMAANAFPLFYVAQNVYDTSESVWNVWNARSATDEMTKIETGIDLVFAVVGWVPVVGAGVKRTFRLVNHKSDIYGPLLFDILRLVLQRAHCPTSPEELVDKLFDASGLKTLLTESREHIEKSWLYREMPSAAQTTFSEALGFVETNLPYWLTQFVERKLMHWKKKQPNSSAEGSVALRKETEKPGKVGVEAEEGHNRSNSAPSTGVVNAKLAVKDITNKITGLLGEHIADYYCYEHLKWGSGWAAHDQGALGHWPKPPSDTVLGKLNDDSQLNKLFAPRARGQGIDGVWRATPANNNGRPFAIVEAKSSRVASKPKGDGKPNVSSKLGVANRIAEEVLPRPDELLEPPIEDDGGSQASSQAVAGGKKGGGKKGGRRQTSGAPTTPDASTPTPAPGPIAPAGGKIAQMTDAWVFQNLPAAVGPVMAKAIRKAGYARHILYIPFYLPSAVQHEAALMEGREHDHGNHDVPLHYTEAEVAKAADDKQARLNKTHGRA